MHDVPLLLETQSADLGDRVEDPAPVNNPPVKCVGNSRMAKFRPQMYPESLVDFLLS